MVKNLLLMVAMAIFLALLIMAGQVEAATKIAWTKDANATGYIIYHTDGTNNYSTVVGDVDTVNIADLGCIPGIPYDFQIIAFNDVYNSVKSNTVTGTLPKNTPIPNPPPIVIQKPNSVTIIIE